MQVARNTVVSLDVELWDIWGNLMERSPEPLQYLHGGYGDIFPAIESALDGLSPQTGADVRVRLEPEGAFGDYDETLLRVELRSRFPEGLEIGMKFEGEQGSGDEGRLFTVTDMAEDKVVLDANHPLSGMALEFRCRIVAIRRATESEIDNRSADDPRSVIMRVLP